MSTALSNNNEYKKNIFFVEPEQVSLKVNDVPTEIRVWAIPESPEVYKDDLIIMIKDNP
jgi:hypothetical protein